ncbi:hypothetical protein I7I48_00345 [Histoplasma ohiense]|nr:hypothetical protein I7I48_00345 [Histoplasma ohiense (nom. inval.)]
MRVLPASLWDVKFIHTYIHTYIDSSSPMRRVSQCYRIMLQNCYSSSHINSLELQIGYKSPGSVRGYHAKRLKISMQR